MLKECWGLVSQTNVQHSENVISVSRSQHCWSQIQIHVSGIGKRMQVQEFIKENTKETEKNKNESKNSVVKYMHDYA